MRDGLGRMGQPRNLVTQVAGEASSGVASSRRRRFYWRHLHLYRSRTQGRKIGPIASRLAVVAPLRTRYNARLHSRFTVMNAEVLKTFWCLEPFECVLVGSGDRYAVQVFTRTEALLTESARTLEQASQCASRMFEILCPSRRFA